MDVQWTIFETDWGWVGVAASPQGLLRVTLPARDQQVLREDLAAEFGPLTAEEDLWPSLRDLRARLLAYWRGEPVAFEDALAPSLGTPFRRRVWATLQQVPRGQTVSYGELARRAGSPQAARAVGQAMAHNPCAVVVPCHRVVAADGGLGGFGGGLDLKARMLNMER